jgi:hypothetical protein
MGSSYKFSMTNHYSPDALDSLGRKIAADDRYAEEELAEAIRPVVGALVEEAIRKRPSLRKHEPDIMQSAAWEAIRYARSYKSEKGRLTSWVSTCVRRELLGVARRLAQEIGAKIPQRGHLDYATAFFKPCVDLAHANDLHASEEDHRAKREAAILARKKLMQTLKRIPFEERRVLMKVTGVHEVKASKNRWAAQRARDAQPMPPRMAAKALGLSQPVVERLFEAAIQRLSSISAVPYGGGGAW